MSTATRPPRPSTLLAELEAAAPARVVKRVRDAPAMAEAWTWRETAAGAEVTADDVCVTITTTPFAIVCTCLLAPKCVHVLAVATALPEAGATEPVPLASQEGPPPAPEGPPPPERAAAGAALASLDHLLRLGAHGADASVRAELARAAYEARSVGLHRLARALARVVRSLRLHAAGHPTFALATLAEEAAEALDVARQLAAGAPGQDLVGDARRTYAPVGTLRLWGLCSEPVLGAGTAGVVTWLADARGRLFEAPDVRPRAAGQAAGVYDVAPPIASMPHRALGREGLFVQGATAAGGRLGAGAGVSAVRSGGVAWDTAPLDALWAAPPLDAGLRFLAGRVAGRWRDALVLRDDDGDPVFVVPGSEHASLPWRDNLTLLARAPGLAVRLVGRDVPGRPRTVTGLAIAPTADAPLLLPAAWAGRVNLGLDRLTTAHLPSLAAAPLDLEGEVRADDPLAPLRRRVERALLGGVASLPGEAITEVARDAVRLRAAMAGAGADVLAALSGAARRPERFAATWLAAARYLAVADGERARRAW